MKNLHYWILALIFITALAVRVYPVTQFDQPLKYDSVYHLRILSLIKDTGSIPSFEPWPYGGRPNLYPPLYHMLILSINFITGLSLLAILKFFLPIVSALTVLAVFWLVRKFSTKNAALLASLFTAINPYLITSSYDSPQVIGLLLSVFAVYLVLKNKYLLASALLGIMFMINTFSALMVSLPVVVYLLLGKNRREIPKLFIFPAIFLLLWYVPKLNVLSCYDSTIGSYFIGMPIGNSWMQESVTMLAYLFIAFALLGRVKGELQKFYLIWVLAFTALQFSIIFTYAFQPWRQGIFISFGFSILLATILNALENNRKVIFTAVFAALFLFGAFYFANYLQFGLSPALSQQEYKMIDWVGKNLPDTAIPLAQHDLCAGLMAYTNKTCALDIFFECIPNKTAWYNYENFFWLERPEEIKSSLASMPVTHVLYRSNQYNERVLEDAGMNKIYSGWRCVDGICDRPAAVYERQPPAIVVRLDDVWAINNSLQAWGYTYQNLENTLAVLKKHSFPVVLAVTPDIADPVTGKTYAIANDPKVLSIIENSGYIVALHGSTHNCTKSDSCEFDGLSVAQDTVLLNGSKTKLENAVNRGIVYFVAPKNRISCELSRAMSIEGMLDLGGAVYDPIESWNWDNKSVVWRGFSGFDRNQYSGKTVIDMHYNVMDTGRLAELDSFLAAQENK